MGRNFLKVEHCHLATSIITCCSHSNFNNRQPRVDETKCEKTTRMLFLGPVLRRSLHSIVTLIDRHSVYLFGAALVVRMQC